MKSIDITRLGVVMLACLTACWTVEMRLMMGRMRSGQAPLALDGAQRAS